MVTVHYFYIYSNRHTYYKNAYIIMIILTLFNVHATYITYLRCKNLGKENLKLTCRYFFNKNYFKIIFFNKLNLNETRKNQNKALLLFLKIKSVKIIP